MSNVTGHPFRPFRSSRPSSQGHRRLGGEPLESRLLLAADVSAWHNEQLPVDVSGDGTATPVDALLVVRDLHHGGSRSLDGAPPAKGLVDVNNDTRVSPADAILVMSALHRAEGEDDALVRFRMQPTDPVSGDPITEIDAGEPFVLQVYTQDLTGRPDGGVFAGYLDVTYDELIEVADPTINHAPGYGNAPSGSFEPGLIDEAGSFSTATSPIGPDEFLLFSVDMQAGATAGTATIAGDPADITPAHWVLVFGELEEIGGFIIPDDRIEFLGAQLQITTDQPGNTAPVAVDDDYTTPADTTLLVDVDQGVLANDIDAEGDVLTAQLATGPVHGQLALSPNGSFQYTPNAGFQGVDTFTYVARDASLVSNEATVTITVVAGNDAPVAQPDFYSVEAGGVLAVELPAEGVLANDSDPDGDPLTARLITGPANGELTEFNADGTFRFVPAEGFTGLDTFTYVAHDGELDSAVTTVTIDVQAVSTDPLVALSLVTTDIAGLIIDTVDVDQDFLLQVFVQDISPEATGIFAAFLDVTYDADLAEPAGNPVASPSYPNAVTADLTTPGLIDEAGAVAGTSPVGGDNLLLLSIPLRATNAGELTFVGDPADEPGREVLRFTVLPSVVPVDRIDYGTTSITVETVQRPVAVDDDYQMLQDQVLTVAEAEGVLANDLSFDLGSLTAILVDQAANGSVQLDADGSFQYTPDAGFVGVDTFTYRAATVATTSDPATVSIDVRPLQPGSVAGTVFLDQDRDGQPGPEELPLGDVLVELTGVNSAGDSVSRTTLTDEDGNYLFTSVPSGSYSVDAQLPQMANDAFDPVTVTLGSGQAVTGVDVASVGVRPAFISNTLYFSSAHRPVHAMAGIDSGGGQSWYTLVQGWDNFQSLSVSLSADGRNVLISALSNSGVPFEATVPATGNPDVSVLGNDLDGYVIRLLAPSSEFGLLPAPVSAAAVDALLAGEL